MSEKKSFWTTTIGVLTAITGLLAAIGGLIGGLIAADIIGGDTTTKVVLTISATEGGWTSPELGQHSYDKDSQVKIIAIPHEGWEFDKWSEDYEGSSNSTTIVLDNDKNVTANFKMVPRIYRWELLTRDEYTPFDIKEVRESVWLALSEESISRDASDLFNMNIQLWSKEEKADDLYDPDMAKDLLYNAGYPLGFKTTVVIWGDDEVLMFIAHSIKKQLEEVNILVDIKIYQMFVPKPTEDILIRRIYD